MAINKTKILNLASKYMRKGQWDNAVVELRKILAEDEKDCNIINQIGDCYVKKGDLEKAVLEFEKAAEIYRREGQNVKAIAMYRKILRNNPDMFDVNSKLAQLFAEQGLIREAIEQYKSVADNYSEKGQIGDALDTYQQIVDLDPGNPVTRVRLAELYENEGFTEKGVREFTRVAEHYLKHDEVDKALNLFQRAAEVDPANVQAKMALAEAYVSVDRTDEALKILNFTLEVYPDNHELLLTSARLMNKTGKYSQAQELFDRIIRLNPNSLEAKEGLGISLGLQGKIEKGSAFIDMVVKERYKNHEYGYALKALKEFSAAVPDHLETHQKMAIIYQKLGQEKGEVEEYSYIADYYLKNRKFEEAYDTYEKLIAKDPSNPEYRDKLDEISELIGRGEGIFSPEYKEETGTFTPPSQSYGVQTGALREEEEYGVEHMENSFAVSEEGEINLNDYDDLNDMSVSDQEESLETEEEDIPLTHDVDFSELEELEEDELPPPPRMARAVPEPEEEVFIEPPQVETVASPLEVLEEVDVYLRYGLDNKATELLDDALRTNPGHPQLTAKLAQIRSKKEEAPAKAPEPARPERKPEPVAPPKPKPAPSPAPAPAPKAHRLSEALPGSTSEELESLYADISKSVRLQLGTQDYEAHYNMGIGYKEMGMIDEAIEEFEVSAQTKNLFIPSYSMIGMCYLERGMYPEAIKTYKKCLSDPGIAPPQASAIIYDLAMAHERSGKIDDALKLYSRVYKQSGKYRDVVKRIKSLKQRLAS